MDINRDIWIFTNYHPVDLGSVELQILDYFANCKSSSIYGIFKNYKEWYTNKSVSYKNIHKRVKRLAELKLIKEIDGEFERGAKHYRLSPYGLVSYLDKVVSENHRFILFNMDNIIIRLLLLNYFEEKTLESFYLLKSFPTEDIGNYLHDCSSLITRRCKKIWNEINQYELDDILPDDETIKQYMIYLDDKPVDDKVLKEIEIYEKKFNDKIKNITDEKLLRGYEFNHYWWYKYHVERIKKVEKKPPYPFDLLYTEIKYLKYELEHKINLLTFELVSNLGDIINSEKIKTQNELEEEILEGGRDYSLSNMLKDKNFFELVQIIKRNFDAGFKQFLYYQR